MAMWHRLRVNRVFAFFALAAVASLVLAPAIAGAHHHENEKAFAETSGTASGLPSFESNCALCAYLSVNDGRSLGSSAPLLAAFALALCAVASLCVFASLGTSSRALSIRAPPVNA